MLENYKNLDAVNVTWTTPGAQSYSLQLLLLWAQNTTAGETGNFIKSEFSQSGFKSYIREEYSDLACDMLNICYDSSQ